MILYSKVETAPTSLPVSLDEVKAALRLTGSEDNALLSSYIESATRMCEAYAGLSFITQTRTVKLTNFRGSDVVLPYGPVAAITSIAYVDDNDDDQTVDDTWYTVDTQAGISKVRINSDFDWPTTNGSLNNVVITYTTGYGDSSAVPVVAKEAIIRRVAHFYENRGDQKSTPDTDWMDLLDTIKVYWNAEY
jgi:uncharacterized phiE125 gp8 family phage protein